MKRIFAFLLFLVIVAGSFYPCCTTDDCCDEVTLTHNDDSRKSEGACSPFFACATCAGFVETAKPILLLQPLMVKKIQHKAAIVFHLTTYSSSFWQPPRAC